jgi:uncharacterized protein
MFRILSLDGGGIKGAFTASVLTTLEEETGCSIADHFDLITGTSTGGILAIGLGLGFSAKQLRDFYVNRGPTIFPRTSITGRPLSFLRWLRAPKHSHAVLREELGAILGERKFGESKCRLVIPTYDANAGRIFMLKTAHDKRFVHDIEALAVDAALATSAAPTYFEASPFPVHEGASYVDGGVWANCPTLVGAVEALAFLGQTSADLDILSIGTTNEPFNIAKHHKSGLAGWNLGVIDLMFAGQMEAARTQAALLAQGRLHRIDFTAKQGQFSLDDARPEVIQTLVGLGRGKAVEKDNLDVVRERFLNGKPASKFVPLKTVSPP